MKRFVFSLLLTSLVLSSAFAQVTPTSQMEKLDRGLVVVKQSTSKKLLSWRFLGTDDWQTTFDVLKDGEVIATDLTATNYSVNDYGTTVGSYQVVAKVNGEEVDRSNIATGWSDYFLPVKLNRPANASNASGSYSYSPNDCSVGDVDGDGQYEIFVKWDPSNSKDNSQGGYTGNVYLDCYKFDLNGVEPAQMLWRIDLGVNIRAGAHYTQFMVYDFDGDGKAELMCKTAPGSKDGQGNYVNQAATVSAIKSASNTKDWRNSDGRVNGGQEYLTVFNGETGAAIHTIAYNPNRNATNALSEAEGTFNWGTNGKNDKGSYGNRGERYLAAVAYLDGPDKRPSGIFSRGYYTFAYIWAVDFDGEKLTQKWFHASDSPTSYKLTTGTSSTRTFTPGAPTGRTSGSRTMYGNGNHNLSIADVDGDGCDEIIWGSAALDNDGKLLYSTGFGHGDAIHLGDFDPDRPGLELFEVHEEKPAEGAWDLHDAATGEIIFAGGSQNDNGRGCAADIIPTVRGAEFWSAYGGYDTANRDQNPYNCQTGKSAGTKKPSMNFRIYWRNNVYDELLDGNNITYYTATSSATVYITGSNTMANYSTATCNSTKNTPNLSGDIFGDWREEVILWDPTDNCTLKIFSTNQATTIRVPTLMHDHTYRMGICWQNVAYNQPPHLGYYLPDYTAHKGIFADIDYIPTEDKSDPIVATYDLNGKRVSSPTQSGIYIQKHASGRAEKIVK